jgi:thiamine pyrophosphate-dependent acetolactate synthase large subunit-like protein
MRHEAAGAFAAGAEAQLTGRLVAGPGQLRPRQPAPDQRPL